MKRLVKHILLYIVATGVIALLLEQVFTYGHYKNVPRSSVDWLMTLEDSLKYDYVVLGSSRSLYHVDPIYVEELTGKKGINLGLQDAKPFDVKLFTKRLIKKNHTKTIVIQIDDDWNDEKSGKKSTASWLPFINESTIWEEFKKLDNKEYYYCKNLPFYKYVHNDSEIGVRDFVKGLTGQELNTIKNQGYTPLEGALSVIEKNKIYNLQLVEKPNTHLLEIIEMCKKSNVKVVFFTAPIYNAKGNTAVLNKYLPNYYDFSNLITNPNLFSDSRHLNTNGARFFTKELSDLLDDEPLN